MKVYLLYANFPTGERIHHSIREDQGIFSTKKLAEKAIDELHGKTGLGKQHCTIVEFILDKGFEFVTL